MVDRLTKLTADADGKRTLFIEEVHSDWHQAVRKQGYKSPASQTLLDEATRQYDAWQAANPGVDAAVWREQNAELSNAVSRAGAVTGVPDAPFKTSWPELGLKRMIRWAAENGFDRIAWTPGDVQAERYDLSKQVSQIDFNRSDVDEAVGVLNVAGMDGDTVVAGASSCRLRRRGEAATRHHA